MGILGWNIIDFSKQNNKQISYSQDIMWKTKDSLFSSVSFSQEWKTENLKIIGTLSTFYVFYIEAEAISGIGTVTQ